MNTLCVLQFKGWSHRKNDKIIVLILPRFQLNCNLKFIICPILIGSVLFFFRKSIDVVFNFAGFFRVGGVGHQTEAECGIL